MWALWLWIAEGKVAFMGLLVLAAALLLGMFTWQCEASIRISGFVLQLTGMVFAISGLLQIRAHFGQTSLRGLFVEWLKRFPTWKRRIGGSAAVVSSKPTSKGIGISWIPDNPGHSIDKRIDAVVANLDHLRDAQTKQLTAVKKLEDSHENHKKEVTEKTKRLETKLHTDLESLHTSDLLTSLVGLVWLTIGILLSTLAPELTRWLGFA